MPIAMKPISPVKPAPLRGIGQIPISASTKPAIAKLAKKASNTQTFSGLKTLNGGLKEKHTVIVIDLSGDTTQYLPYHVHCNTCGFESKLTDMESAISMARGHVGI